MKRTRHIYKRFFSIAMGQNFFIRRGKLAVKRGLFSCQVIGGSVQTVAPWRKVRTTTPVKTLRPPSGILRNVQQEIADGKYFPRAKDCLGADGRTHYVGDDCPGGHRDPMVQDHTPSPTPEHERTL